MKKRYILLAAALLCAACVKPKVEFVDFETFKVRSVKSTEVALEDGSVNPEVQFMESEDPETKVAVTSVARLTSDLLGAISSNNVIHVSGTYTGHDIDGSPITLSGKLLVPRDGKVKNLVIVSHYTIGANYECPSECFPMPPKAMPWWWRTISALALPLTASIPTCTWKAPPVRWWIWPWP